MANRLSTKTENVGATVSPRLLAVVAGAVLLASCQTGGPPVLSLEEAKQITAKFEGAFTPPPKTIKDITAILDEQKRADPAAAARARATAMREPPPGIRGSELAEFYMKRGVAAGRIGDVRRQIADFKEALRLSSVDWGRRTGEWGKREELLWDLGRVESGAGNFADGIRHFEQSLAEDRGGSVARRAALSMIYAMSGDMEGADRHFAKAETNLTKTKFEGDWGRWGNIFTRAVRKAESRILYYKGRYAEAETTLRSALRASEEALRDNPHKYNAGSHDSLRRDLAMTLARQGRLVEAEIEARKALTSSLRRLGRYSPMTAYMLRELTAVIGAQGRHSEAEKLARAVIDIFRQTGATDDSRGLASARLALATTLVSQGRWTAALGEYDAIKTGLATDPETFERFFAHDLGWALALAGAGRAADARSIAEAALRRSLKMVGEKHYNTAAARGVLAMALTGLDERKVALAGFAKAIPILLSRSRQADDETTNQAARDQRLGLILESYIGLLADTRGTATARDAGIDAAAEAFRIADVARSRSVQRALAASSARAAAEDPALADLVRREQDTQKQVGALFGLFAEVLSAPTDQRDPQALNDLRTRIDQLRGARAALMEEIEARFPEYAELINPKPATVADARVNLDPGEALIATYVGEKRTYVWAVPQAGEVAFAAVAMGREEMEDTVALLRSALEPNAATLGDIPDFDVAEAYGLYESLLKPVEAGWKDARSLLVVAHGPLGYLPLSVLPTRAAGLGEEQEPLFSNYRAVPWLARRHAVTMLPSVASLKTLRGLPPGAPERKSFAGFGDPLFSTEQAAQPVKVAALTSRGLRTRGQPVRLRAAPKTTDLDSAGLAQLPRLPDTADEVRSIALAIKADLTRDVFLGRRANEGMVKSLDLSGYKVLAFATHGLVPGDLDGLTQPALALSSPTVAGGTDDGLLTMGEILGLKLDADWVVLSACNTGSGAGAGAEAVSGLGRAFFYAGTRALLVSNWPVETTSAKALTTDLFRRQAADAELRRAQALHQAMLSMIDEGGYVDPATGKMVFSYAHPLFWAPFTLIGDGGGARPRA